MKLARVVGNVVSTVKDACYTGKHPCHGENPTKEHHQCIRYRNIAPCLRRAKPLITLRIGIHCYGRDDPGKDFRRTLSSCQRKKVWIVFTRLPKQIIKPIKRKIQSQSNCACAYSHYKKLYHISNGQSKHSR